MNKSLRIVVGILALVFALIGLRWLVDPAGAAGELGMPLLDGLGRSTQIGDMGSFFLSVALFILLALTTGRRSWYYPPIILLTVTAFMRTIAWIFHDASLALDMIAVEIIVSVILYVASSKLSEQD